MGERHKIDARGAFCPGPLMELIASIKLAEIGDEIEVLSSDKGSANDIPDWSRKSGNELVSVEENEGFWSIVVRKLK